MNKLDFNKIKELVADGLVTMREHNGLFVLNYTLQARFEDFMKSPELMACRGLIVDDYNNIVARPFEKFFNYGQVVDQIPNLLFEIEDKADGSLGIIYWPITNRGRLTTGNNMNVSTRGSMQSEQAIHATELLHSKYRGLNFNPGWTYLTEIIYPENRIVVDYNGMDDLVLLAVIDTASGVELDKHKFNPGLPVIKSYGMANPDRIPSLLAMDDENREGFVLHFENGFRVKVKFDEYQRLHRIMTALTKRDIWEGMRDDKPISANLDNVPEDIERAILDYERELSHQFIYIRDKALHEFNQMPKFEGALLNNPNVHKEMRKSAALYFQQECHNPQILFALLDEKPIDPLIWKMLYPKADVLLSRSTKARTKNINFLSVH